MRSRAAHLFCEHARARRGTGQLRLAPGKRGSVCYDENTNRDCAMANVYIEARPKGRPEGSHIDDYVVEDHAVSVLADIKTQHEAIQWAKASGHNPLVARVRHLKDKKGLITGGRLKTLIFARTTLEYASAFEGKGATSACACARYRQRIISEARASREVTRYRQCRNRDRRASCPAHRGKLVGP